MQAHIPKILVFALSQTASIRILKAISPKGRKKGTSSAIADSDAGCGFDDDGF
jgi:hypothetical protein